jgi:hypothetical protein
MAELFAPDSGVRLEVPGSRIAAALQPKAATVAPHTRVAACFDDDDESSCEAKAVKAFLQCSQDWEQLRSLTGAPLGVTVQNTVQDGLLFVSFNALFTD